MFKKRMGPTDEFEFLRRRAAELLDQGRDTDAMRLIQVIDLEQVRRILAEASAPEKIAH